MTTQTYDVQAISIDHITIKSNNSFGDVRTKLEGMLHRFDDGIFTLLQYGETQRALKELESQPNLTIFGSRDHGGLLGVVGLHRKAIQYDIGNALTASKMTQHHISASLYAPIRVLLRESPSGVVAFEYDRPASIFGQFGDREIDAVANQLDQDLQATLTAAAS